MKKNSGFLIVLCMLLVFGSFSLSAEQAEPIEATGPITVFLNGGEIRFDQPPVIENGRTLVPARAILEALGLSLSFNEALGEVTAENAGTKILMTLGSTAVFVNGEEVLIDVPAKILGGRTMVPLRFIGESMDLTVDWDENTRVIRLDDKAVPTATPKPTPKPTATPKPEPTPTPEPEGFFHMSDEDIRAAIEESLASGMQPIDLRKKTVELYEKRDEAEEADEDEEADKYREEIRKWTRSEEGSMTDILRTDGDCLVVTPYTAILTNPYERREISEYEAYVEEYGHSGIESLPEEVAAYLKENVPAYESYTEGYWQTEWSFLSDAVSGEGYFDQMKTLYENEFDAGNVIYVYIEHSDTRETLTGLRVLQNGSEMKFTETRDDGHTFDFDLNYDRESEEDELYRTKVRIDLREIDPEKPFEIEYDYRDYLHISYDIERLRRNYDFSEQERTRTIEIDLSEYK